MELQEVMSAHPELKTESEDIEVQLSALLDYTVQLANVFRGQNSKGTGKSHINLNKVQLNRNEELHNYEISCFSILPAEMFSAYSEFPNVHSNFNDSSNGFYTSQIIEEYENLHTLLYSKLSNILFLVGCFYANPFFYKPTRSSVLSFCQ